MKSIITAAVLVAAAGAASAQSVELMLDWGGTALNEGETRTVTVSAAFTGGGASLVAADFVANLTNGTAANAVINDPPFNTGTVDASGGSITVSALGQADIFNLDMTNPIDLFTFELTAGSAGTIDILVDGGSIFNTLDGFVPVSHDLTNRSFSIDVVPTPGAIAVAGLGGLVAARRRR